MDIKIYNSLTGNLETLKTIHDGEVDMYVCGPTVYNDPHPDGIDTFPNGQTRTGRPRCKDQ